MHWKIFVVVSYLLFPGIAAAGEPADPFLWLEEIEGQKALDWVQQQNAASEGELKALPEYPVVFKRSLQIFDSQDRIPYPQMRGPQVYNFWQDAEHERGLWRRADLASYRTGKPAWEILLDVDALGKAEGQPWVFHGSSCLPPDYDHCLVFLSHGGSDAAEVREFDPRARSFVTGGFFVPQAKNAVSWKDADTLWVGTDFGPGSLTASGYPRIVKEWRRGTPLAEARTVYEGGHDDVSVHGMSEFTPEGRYDLVERSPAFFQSETFLQLGGRLVKLDLPLDAELRAIFKEQLVVSLRSEWKPADTVYREGALIAIPLDDLLRGKRVFSVLFEPGPRESLGAVGTTRDRLLLTTLANVRSKLYRLALVDGAWVREEVALPGLGTAGVVSASDETDAYFYVYEDFLTPDTLFFSEAGRTEKVWSLPAFFEPTGMTVEQFEAKSKDGTRIPYFVIEPQGFKADGRAPALLHGYGGFEVPLVPGYSPVAGTAWIARGGVFVQANIRGGGEFGPAWHKAAVKEHHHRNFEDFAAVAEDLIRRKITSARHLGIVGGSQGGLLVGGTFVKRPELFRAVVCQVPLLDMRRYSKLLAGASWMAEYGDPDVPAEWKFIKTWSPYQNLKKGAKYPEVFFWTNTRDDRVHPGHARKMVAKMLSLGHPVLYFENTEGGHGSGAVNKQRAHVTALQYAYLWKMLR